MPPHLPVPAFALFTMWVQVQMNEGEHGLQATDGGNCR